MLGFTHAKPPIKEERLSTALLCLYMVLVVLSFCCLFVYCTVLPHILPFDFDGEANNGDNTQLTCYVNKGDIPLNITWSLNGKNVNKMIDISTTVIGTRTNLLTINSVQPEHSGVYTCTASNKGGSAVHSAQLFINGTLFVSYLVTTFSCSQYHLKLFILILVMNRSILEILSQLRVQSPKGIFLLIYHGFWATLLLVTFMVLTHFTQIRESVSSVLSQLRRNTLESILVPRQILLELLRIQQL